MNLDLQYDSAADSHRGANRHTDEFLAMLGHEMRNPLSALNCALDVWEHAKDDHIQLAKLRDIMKRQVSQLIRLSDDLFDAGRITQGKLTLRQEQVEVRQLIDGACEQIRPFIDRFGHSLAVHKPTEPVAIFGDPCRLLQVFANLLQNAAKFTDPGGRLYVNIESQDDMAIVRVGDNGPGIKEHMLSNIFESFAQPVGPCGPENGGLGIGLKLVRTIVELHGGSVVARSAGLGHGSEFTVQLPLGKSAGDGLSPNPRPVVKVGRQLPACRIVVVDDVRMNRELLARMLRMTGQSVMVASSGETAVGMVLDERPQVVFLDLMMDGIDGFEVARRLRGHPEVDGLVLIALSGNGDNITKQRAINAGFDAYLVKPTSFSELNKIIAAYGPQS